MGRVALAPGDLFVVEDRTVEGRFIGGDAESITRDVWFVALDPPAGAVQHSAHIGQATWFRDGRLQLASSVPLAIAVRDGDFGTAVARPTTAGEYRLEGVPGWSLLVEVTRDAPPLDLPVARPAAVPAHLQLLGENDLAGVEFGTRDEEAEDRLVATFGPPTGRKSWQGGCVGQYRWVWWGGLVVEFRREDASAEGRLASYSFIRSGWSDSWFDLFEGAGLDVASVRGLATRDGVALGMTVAELRGVSERAEFRTAYIIPFGDRWNIPGNETVAVLDRDFLVPGAHVIRISAPKAIALTTC